MARVISPVWSQIRGSIAGTTYLTNQFHQIIARQRTNPVQPQTSYQTLIKTALSQASALWLGLTNDQRLEWDSYAATCFFQGPLGSYTVPGRQMFIACHSMRLYLQSRGVTFGSVVTTAPLSAGFLSLGGVGTAPVMGAGTTGFIVTVDNPNTDPCLAFCTRSIAFNPTRTRFQGPWLSPRLLSISMPQPGTFTMTYLGLIANMRYFAIVRALSRSGPIKMSASFIVNALANSVPPNDNHLRTRKN